MVYGQKLGTSGFCLGAVRRRLGVSRRFRCGLAHLTVMADIDASGIEPVVSLSELAARLGVSPQTIYDLRSQGRGPRGFRIGRQLRFRTSEVDAWLRRLEDNDGRRDAEVAR